VIALIDYGAGNVTSVERALKRVGAQTMRCASGEALRGARAIVLPGVGHFGHLVRTIDERGLRAPLLDALRRGVPFLGICLGMQFLYEGSDEAPDAHGLGLLAGRVKRLASPKLPHMGWNQVGGTWLYFAHSYAVPADAEAVTEQAEYGEPFAAALARGTLRGVQYHPEKSGRAGEALLRAFAELVR
jgi:glutamine amidotransferase